MHSRAGPRGGAWFRGRAADRLAYAGDLDRVFFTNGGADANEHAVRMARLHTGRHKVLSTYRSYHGGTQLAINVTGDPRRWANDTGAQGTVHFFGPFLYRSVFSATTEDEECQRALEHLEQVIAPGGAVDDRSDHAWSRSRAAGRHDSAAWIHAGGPRVVHEAWHRADHRRDHGRAWTDREMVRDRADDVVPDLLTFAKGVNSGYVPSVDRHQ